MPKKSKLQIKVETILFEENEKYSEIEFEIQRLTNQLKWQHDKIEVLKGLIDGE